MTQQIERADLEQIHEDATSPEFDVKVERAGDVTGVSELHSELSEMADSFNVRGFKCAHEECGLLHQHDTTKHRGSDSFDMSEEEAAEMEANPNCHCGLAEAARTGVSGAPSPTQANKDAPIPDSMTRHLDSSL